MFVCSYHEGNGVIDFPEFVQLMEDQKKPDEREADMMRAFRVFDADNKGYIESAELRYILLNMDKRIPRDELHEMIVSAKLDEDKKVTYQGNLRDNYAVLANWLTEYWQTDWLTN